MHGKATILQKMYGEYEDKFPQARALYMYMYAHPGKKLNFMANEIGQLREWDENREQDWDILTYPAHDSFHRFMCELNQIYGKYAAFSDFDYSHRGFQWIDCHAQEQCIYAFERIGKKQKVLAVFNFSDKPQEYELVLPGCEKLKLQLASDEEKYGGKKAYKKRTFSCKAGKLTMSLSSYSGMYFLLL